MKNGNGALTPMPLPRSAQLSAEPNLSFDRAMVLAGTVPTPFLVLAPSRIQQSIRTLRTCLPGVELYYAMKSNPDPELLGLLEGLVDGIDVASYPEVALAAAAGVAPERLFHSHPVKKDTDIVACVRHGVNWFTFDNPDEVPKLRLHAPEASVLLRVAIKNENCVVDLGAKYGAHQDEALALILQARAAGVNVRGIAFHVGSQSSDPATYITALKVVRGLFDRLRRRESGWIPWTSAAAFRSSTAPRCPSSRTSAVSSPAGCPRCFPLACASSPSRAGASRAIR